MRTTIFFIIFSILVFSTAFGQLTKQDLEEIRSIVREEVRGAEDRLNVRIDNVEKRIEVSEKSLNTRMDDLNTRMDGAMTEGAKGKPGRRLVTSATAAASRPTYDHNMKIAWNSSQTLRGQRAIFGIIPPSNVTKLNKRQDVKGSKTTKKVVKEHCAQIQGQHTREVKVANRAM